MGTDEITRGGDGSEDRGKRPTASTLSINPPHLRQAQSFDSTGKEDVLCKGCFSINPLSTSTASPSTRLPQLSTSSHLRAPALVI